jgi:hypothetical protein
MRACRKLPNKTGFYRTKRAFTIDTQWHKYNCSLPVPPRQQSVHRAAAAHLGAQARALFDMQRCVRARRRQRRAKLRRIEQPPLRRWLEDYDREAILVCARVLSLSDRRRGLVSGTSRAGGAGLNGRMPTGMRTSRKAKASEAVHLQRFVSHSALWALTAIGAGGLRRRSGSSQDSFMGETAEAVRA